MGLMPQQTQGPPFADPNAPVQPQPQPGADEQSNVSPEEQAIYDTVMKQAGKLIYGEGKVMPEIIESLKPGDAQPTGDEQADAAKGNPAVLSLANTATQIVSKLDASAKEAGQPIPDEVLYHAGSEVVSMLAEVAEAAKLHDYSEEEINGAFLQAVDNYRPIAEAMGRTDQDTLKQQFGEVVAADEQGQLGSILPGLDSAANQPQG